MANGQQTTNPAPTLAELQAAATPSPKTDAPEKPTETKEQRIARVQRAIATYRHNMKANAPRSHEELRELQSLLMPLD